MRDNAVVCKLPYSDPNHPMYNIFIAVRDDPHFVDHTYDEIVWLIDNETKRRKQAHFIGSVLAVIIVWGMIAIAKHYLSFLQ